MILGKQLPLGAKSNLDKASDVQFKQATSYGKFTDKKTSRDMQLLNNYSLSNGTFGHLPQYDSDAFLQERVVVNTEPTLFLQDFFNRHAYRRDPMFLKRHMDIAAGVYEKNDYYVLPCGTYF